MDHRLTDREWADEWRHLDHVSLQTGNTAANGLRYRKNVKMQFVLLESNAKEF